MAQYWLKYGNSVLSKSGSNILVGSPYDPYNPLELPPYTIRCKFSSGTVPTEGTQRTLVDSTNNIWDILYPVNDWTYLFDNDNTLLEIIGANTALVTRFTNCFYKCENLRTVSLFDTRNSATLYGIFRYCSAIEALPLFSLDAGPDMSYAFEGDTSLSNLPYFNLENVSNITSMCNGCTGLTSIPLFDTHNIAIMNYAFRGCTNVQTGALALYQQASTQTTPPSYYRDAFKNCGSGTTSGAAELAQIPASWGGTAT